jgi:hypothetical protein
LAASLTDPSGDGSPSPAQLAAIEVYRRAVSFTQGPSAIPIPEPVQFGTHARLVGYSIDVQDGSMLLELDWEILQTLLPAHHIFVHLTGPDGALLSQVDGAPTTAGGPAPSGSWLPGEFLRTIHTLPLPAGAPDPVETLTMQAGLYDPVSQARLPATQSGQPVGDSARLPVAP